MGRESRTTARQERRRAWQKVQGRGGVHSLRHWGKERMEDVLAFVWATLFRPSLERDICLGLVHTPLVSFQGRIT